ncbi:MAG: DUF4271 domain-containing protein [Flavobacteriaceae bacterium]
MEAVLRTAQTPDWITFLIFASLIFIVLAKGFFYGKYMNFMILPINNKYIFLYNKKDKLMNGFQVFLTLFQLFNSSLFLYLIGKLFLGIPKNDDPLLFMGILGGLVVFLLLKISLQLVSAFIFDSEKTILEIIFKKLSYFNYSALVMFLANAVLSFIFIDSKIVVYVAIFLILWINIIGWSTLLKNHQNFIAANFFYFILYLCALEIAPLVLIGSFLNR